MPPFMRRPVSELQGVRHGARVEVSADGRIPVPAHLRRAAGTEPGNSANVRVEEGRLVIEGPMVALRRLQDLLAPLRKPGFSMVDGFIPNRRAVWGEG